MIALKDVVLRHDLDPRLGDRDVDLIDNMRTSSTRFPRLRSISKTKSSMAGIGYLAAAEQRHEN